MSFDFDGILARKKKTNVEKIAVKRSEPEPVAPKKFDYSEVPEDIAQKLHSHEKNLRNIQSKAMFDMGEELQAAHDELANYRNGSFYAWCESIGIKATTADNILNYHSFIAQNLGNKTLLESLPKSLIYETAKKSAPQELKAGVLNGDITTLKEYKELKAELEAAKKAKEDAEQRAAIAESHQDSLERGNKQAWKEAKESREAMAASEKARDQMQEERDEAQAQAEKFRSAWLEAKNNPPTVIETSGVPQEKYDRLKNELENLRNNPTVERVEVEPDDYESLKRENAMLRAQKNKFMGNEKSAEEKEYENKCLWTVNNILNKAWYSFGENVSMESSQMKADIKAWFTKAMDANGEIIRKNQQRE